MSSYEPHRVYSFVKAFDDLEYYPIDETLAICKEKGISDASAFLMERSGDMMGGLNVLLRDFSLKVRAVKRDIDTQLRIEMSNAAAASSGGSSGSVSGRALERSSLVYQILGKQGVARSESAARLPAFKVLQHIVLCSADVCARHHSSNQNSPMFFTLFDHLVNERRK
jgi:hypothetical protein